MDEEPITGGVADEANHTVISIQKEVIENLQGGSLKGEENILGRIDKWGID